jgi:hypothetical protein
MDELDYNIFIGLSLHFGGNKRAHWSSTAGVGMSYKIQKNDGFGAQLNANAAVNFYNGGLGALSSGNKLHIDQVYSAGLTLGGGNGAPMTINPFHLDSGSGMVDRFKYSGSIGTNFIRNNSGRNQQVGFAQLRAFSGSFTFYNDFDGFRKIGIADGYDRWWTGGGNLTIGSRNSEFQLIIGSDVFTADTDSQVKNFNDSNGGPKSGYSFDKQLKNTPKPKGLGNILDYTPNTAKELNQEYLDNYRNFTPYNSNAHSFDLNQGRTSFRLNTPYGQFGANKMGQSSMISQDLIHRMINFHLIPSSRPNSWEFQYKNGTP